MDEIVNYVFENTPDEVTFWETVLKCMSPFALNSICFVIVSSNLDEYSQLRYLMDADRIDEFFRQAEQKRYYTNPVCRKYMHDIILMNFSDRKMQKS